MSSVLFILPCAGGSAASYDEWKQYIQCPVYIIEYAGHWQRHDEPLYEDVESLSEDILHQILGNIETTDDVYILGHSMGGVIAWFVSDLLEKKYRKSVTGIFLAACFVPNSQKYKSALQEDELSQLLKQSSGFTEKVLKSSFFKTNLLPIFQRDFLLLKNICEISDMYKMQMDISIMAIVGSNDPFVSYEDMKEWQKYTIREIEICELNGNHMFLYEKDNLQYICKEIINAKVR